MTINIGINGFGRIGRVVTRIIEERRQKGSTKLKIRAINDLVPCDDMAYLLKYDSVHRRFNAQVSSKENGLIVNEQSIAAYKEKSPKDIPWAKHDIDVVLEATGHFLVPEKANDHIDAGAKKVLLSAPAKGTPDATICYGVNTNAYKNDMSIVSTASCTTNCIAPVAKVIHENLGIKKSFVTTIHSYTNDQRLLDLPHKDKRRARAAALSMIPTTTGAAKAISLVMPELEGKFQGMAIRVPTPNVSLIDMVCEVDKNADTKSINALLKEAASNELNGVLGFSDEPLVSVDMLGTNCSSIIDSLCTQTIENKLIKVIAWYDNEWGFANRAVDLLELMG